MCYNLALTANCGEIPKNLILILVVLTIGTLADVGLSIACSNGSGCNSMITQRCQQITNGVCDILSECADRHYPPHTFSLKKNF